MSGNMECDHGLSRDDLFLLDEYDKDMEKCGKKIAKYRKQIEIIKERREWIRKKCNHPQVDRYSTWSGGHCDRSYTCTICGFTSTQQPIGSTINSSSSC
jgi:hypothetical protein